ncbi:MAG: hypothetical protein HQL75_00315 [Magnetococcales bacterium]|nr:hypothetical protein [Magnetococcales bacterium]
MSAWDDALAMLQIDVVGTFGTPVVYTPSALTRIELGGIPRNLSGIFDEHVVDQPLHGSGSFEVQSVRSELEIRVSELGVDPMVDDTVTIGGSEYMILEVLFDGKGMAKLVLNKIAAPFPVP